MTARRAALTTLVALLLSCAIPPGWGHVALVCVMFYVWGAYLLVLDKRVSKFMTNAYYEKREEQAQKKKKNGTPDTDDIRYGAIDEDLFLWDAMWRDDDG